MVEGRGNVVAKGLTRREIVGVPLIAGLAVGMAGAAQARPVSDKPSLEARAEIDDLFTAYVWAYDCNKVDDFLALFVDDDPVVIGLGTPHRGKPALAAWFEYLMAIRNRENDLWLHQAAHHVYRQNGNGWIIYSYATHFNFDTQEETYGVRSLGYFVSELVPAGHGFLFKRFSITHWDREATPWEKPLPWADVDGIDQ